MDYLMELLQLVTLKQRDINGSLYDLDTIRYTHRVIMYHKTPHHRSSSDDFTFSNIPA